MTIGEFIEMLERYDEDAKVLVADRGMGYVNEVNDSEAIGVRTFVGKDIPYAVGIILGSQLGMSREAEEVDPIGYELD